MSTEPDLSASFIPSIESDAAVMISIASTTPLDRPVPSCPGWTIEDLIVHTGIVHRHKTIILADDWREESPPQPPGPGDQDIVEWFADGVVAMIDTMRSIDLAQPRWTWCSHDHAATGWVRRMAHETAIHTADAILAAGEVPMLDSALAIDGVDEILDEMMVGAPSWGELAPQPGVIELRTGSRTWTLGRATVSGTSPASGTTFTDLPALRWADEAPDVRVASDPSTLDLWLWGRGELGSDDVVGDRDMVDHVRHVAADATG